MDTTYETYIKTIDGIEQIEQQVITNNRIKRCCTLSLEFMKAVIICFKHSKKSK